MSRKKRQKGLGTRRNVLHFRPETLAYFAGLFDGEGSVSVAKRWIGRYRRGYGLVLTIRIASTQHTILREAQQLFGGTVYRYWRPSPWRPLYNWQLYGRRAQVVLSSLLPYLRLKRLQAELAMQFPIRSSLRLTKRDAAEQLHLRHQIMKLNAKPVIP